MKFGTYLLANLTPEWNSQYIRYEYLKEFLDKTVTASSVLANDDDKLIYEEYFLRVDDDFFQVKILSINFDRSILSLYRIVKKK